MGPPVVQDRRKELFEVARRIKDLAGIEYGEVVVKVHQGRVVDVVKTERYRDDAG